MVDNIMVSVICTAYNHELFIEEAIKGIINQKTDFSIELIIHDDASTDKTAEIIKKYEKEYPNTIKAIYQKENQFSKGYYIYPQCLFPKVHGRYIAFCEGDDYWIDDKKLQKQVDFLETHQDYSMCIHNAIKLDYRTGKQVEMNTFAETGTYSQQEQVQSGLGSDFPAFASYMLRTEVLKNVPKFFVYAAVLDYPLRQYYASQGKVYYFADVMSVYRVATPQSYMRKTVENQEFYNNYTLNMIKFFEKFNQYTERKFADIIENKIISDYLGFCMSIERALGLAKAYQNGLDIDKVSRCYDIISEGYVSNDIYELKSKSKTLFIYGTSRVADICRTQMQHHDIEFEGYVVSDGQMKADLLEGKRVYCLSEVIEKYENPGFILAIQPVNAMVVKEIIEHKGIKNYREPYKLKYKVK